MAVSLRPYQAECLDSIEASFSSGKRRVMVVMATGLGKTIVFAELIHRWRKSGRVTSRRPAVVIAHREELLQQAADKIFNSSQDWIPIGIERASERAPVTSEVIVASVQTVGRLNNGRLDNVLPSLIIIDECHHVAAASYQHALQKLGAFSAQDVYTLGVTATPYRLDNRSIAGKNGTFEAEVFRADILAGIESRFLCDMRSYAVRTETDLSGVKKRGDDFVESDLAKVLNGNSGRTLNAIKAWKEHAHDRKTIVFCPSVSHAIDTAELWKGHTGATSACIHGGTDPSLRRDIMDMFRRGRIQVLTNVDVATEGFDVPDIGCVVLLKPTLSWTKYVQMVGRGTRTAEGKQDCVVLDMVDLSAEHSICTVPAMLGLPPALDLKGATMRNVSARASSVTEEAANAFTAVAKGRKELPTLEDLDVIVMEVSLTGGGAGGRMKNAKASAYSWSKMADGSFALSTHVGVAKIKFDAVGNAKLILHGARSGIKTYDLPHGADAHTAVVQAEKKVLRAFGADALKFKKRNAGWKNSTVKPSEAQLNLLLRLGVRKESLSGLNKATASQMIDKIMAERAVRKAGI